VSMPDGDGDTVASLRAGNTVGCSQIETPVIRGVLRRIPVRGVADLMATLALARPGPRAAEARTEFVRRANGEAAREPVHPRLADRLRENYGMLCTTKISAATALTSWPLGAADEMRCALIDAAPAAAPPWRSSGACGVLPFRRTAGDGERSGSCWSGPRRTSGQGRVGSGPGRLGVCVPHTSSGGIRLRRLNSYGSLPSARLRPISPEAGAAIPHVNIRVAHRLEDGSVRPVWYGEF
jgi:hypothetical protein